MGRSRPEEKLVKATALLYHDVVPAGEADRSGFQAPGANRYKLTERAWDEHVKAISDACAAAPISVFKALTQPGEEALLLTFDDGGASAAGRIAATLGEQGWVGHFFVTTDFIGTNGFLSETDIRELHSQGHVIGSHTCSHPPRMSACTQEELKREWSGSISRLSHILGEPVETASIPGGYYSEEIARAASAAGFRVLFTSEPRTKAWTVDDCLCLGRYSVLALDPAVWAGQVVAGSAIARTRAYLAWEAKKVLKRVGGEAWLKLRARLLPN
jgi:peptidoglycan/xylan/chitin deacetylase (PgdA/CDA1 family)